MNQTRQVKSHSNMPSDPHRPEIFQTRLYSATSLVSQPTECHNATMPQCLVGKEMLVATTWSFFPSRHGRASWGGRVSSWILGNIIYMYFVPPNFQWACTKTFLHFLENMNHESPQSDLVIRYDARTHHSIIREHQFLKIFIAFQIRSEPLLSDTI